MYDRTGSTDEVLGGEDFDWLDFYREQLSAMLDTRAISDFQRKYQGSDEEKADLLEAYITSKGDMDRIYDSVMLSNVIDDDERFREIIDNAIADHEVEDFPKYSEESESKRQRRLKRAQKEAKEAEKLAEEVETKKKKTAGAKVSKVPAAGEDDLLALITKRKQERGQGFLAQLEEKYGGKAKGKKRSPADEPPEEAFAATEARKKKSKGVKSKSKEDKE